MLLFIHMHKAAGTTVRKSAAASGLALPERNRNGNLFGCDGKPVFYAGRSSDDVKRLISAQVKGGVDFLAMELDFPAFEHIPRRSVTMFTVLRDPFERAVSNFRHRKRRGRSSPDLSFVDDMSSGFGADDPALSRTGNYYVRKLSGQSAVAGEQPIDETTFQRAKHVLKRLDRVIVLGRDDLRIELRALGIDIFRVGNVAADDSPRVPLTPDQLAVSAADAAWFAEANALDIRLFAWARRRSADAGRQIVRPSAGHNRTGRNPPRGRG